MAEILYLPSYKYVLMRYLLFPLLLVWFFTGYPAFAEDIPQGAVAMMKKADSLRAGQEYREAYRIYNRLLERFGGDLDPSTLAKLYYGLGLVSYRLDKDQDALRYFDKSMMIHPGSREVAVRSYILRGLIYRRRGEYHKELEMYREAEDHFLNAGDSIMASRFTNDLGYAFMTHGQYREAESCFEKALSLLAEGDTDNVFLRARYLGNIARVRYHQGYYARAIDYHRRARDLFRQSGSSGMTKNISANIANQTEGMGLVFLSLGMPDTARYFLEQSLRLREDIGDKLGTGMCYDGLGEVYRNKGEYQKALEYYRKALQVKEVFLQRFSRGSLRYLQAVESESVTRLNMGRLYLNWDKPEPALQVLDTALALAREVGYEKGKAEVLLEKGQTLMKTGKEKKGLDHYHRALQLFRKMDNGPGIALALQYIGSYHASTGEWQQALFCYEQSLSFYRQSGSRQHLPLLYRKMGTIYRVRGEPDSACLYLLRGLALAQETGLKKDETGAWLALARYYEQEGQYDSSLTAYKAYVSTREALFDEETARTLAILQAGYDYGQKEQALKLLAQENEIKDLTLKKTRMWAFLLVAFFILAGLGAWIFLWQQKLRDRQKMLELEQKLLRSQMNPHFIFNALAAIQSFFFTSNPAEASGYISKFARLIRLILDNSRKTWVSLDKEIELLQNYLALQQMRYKGKFEFEIRTALQDPPGELFIPPMLTQPFVENSIEHGIVPKKEKGHIKILFQQREGYLLFSVEDDGVGMGPDPCRSESRTSHGMKITRERLKHFKYPRKIQRDILIEDLRNENEDSGGTRVTFSVPYRHAV